MPSRGADASRAIEPGYAAGDERLRCFDGLRGVLATYVTVSHAVPFAAVPAWLAGPFLHGGAAVDVFFALSGFVIARAWEAHGADPERFLAARARRIYPAYLCVLLFAIPGQLIPLPADALRWASPAGWEIWSGGWPADGWLVLGLHVVMAHGVVPDGLLPDAWVGWLGAAWSLSTEWQFYLLVAWVGPRLGRGHPFILRLTLLLMCMAAAGFAYDRTMPQGWLFSRAFLPEKAAYFALGVAGAGAFGLRSGRWWLLLLALENCLAFSTQAGMGKALPPLVWVACLAVQRWPSAPLLRVPARWLSSAQATGLGAISFSLYLVNEPVQKTLGVVLAWFAGADAGLFTLFWLPLAIGLSLAAASVLHWAVEQPFRRRPSRRRLAVGLHAPHAGVAQW
ncbi:MAG TPA: acyltransferase [Acidisphaera sp.]|nr:acyltransferase [Acidisphaera sp.]